MLQCFAFSLWEMTCEYLTCPTQLWKTMFFSILSLIDILGMYLECLDVLFRLAVPTDLVDFSSVFGDPSFSASRFLRKNIPVRTKASDKTSTTVIASDRIKPENITPKTEVVEYSKTVLTAPMSFIPIKKNNVDIPVPKIDNTKMPGNCIKSTSIGI